MVEGVLAQGRVQHHLGKEGTTSVRAGALSAAYLAGCAEASQSWRVASGDERVLEWGCLADGGRVR